MAVIEVRPHAWGWKVFKASGVEPVFLNQQDAIDYATGRACCEIDIQDAEHFLGELGPTFPVVRSTSESNPQTERQCAEKLTF